MIIANTRNRKQTTITLKLSTEEESKLNRYLEKSGMKKGAFVRKAILEQLARENAVVLQFRKDSEVTGDARPDPAQ